MMTESVETSQVSPPELPAGDPPRRYRLRGLLVLVPCAIILGLSAWLQPSPRGDGTHEQLGLSPCGAMVNQGWPCPSCGMTTAFAATAHGDILAALRAQAFGPFLFAAVVVLAVVGAAELLTGRNYFRRLHMGWWCLWVPVLGMLIGWGIKAYIGWKTGQYPLS